MSIKNALDQYYTSSMYAQKCYEDARPWFSSGIQVEPCAGAGAFFECMPINNRLGMDLDPVFIGEGHNPEPVDFLKYSTPFTGATVISNPPFGQNASLAVSFFNKCAILGADTIAFVIPRTFRKASIINKLDPSFIKVFDELSPPLSFILDGKPYNVPCCFQVWVRSSELRTPINTEYENDLFSFCNKEVADFAVRRVGGRAGKLLENTDQSKESTYFLKSKINPDELRVIHESVDLSEERDNTAGVRSIAKYELVNKAKGLL